MSKDELRKKAEEFFDSHFGENTSFHISCCDIEDLIRSVQSAQREEDLRAAEEAADELYPEVDPCRNACFAIIDAIRAQGE